MNNDNVTIETDADPVMREVFDIISARGTLGYNEIQRSLDEGDFYPTALYEKFIAPAIDDLEIALMGKSIRAKLEGERIVAEARDLIADSDGTNPEYERAVVELIGRTYGLQSDDYPAVAEAIGATSYNS